jgi:hypothetical protein
LNEIRGFGKASPLFFGFNHKELICCFSWSSTSTNHGIIMQMDGMGLGPVLATYPTLCWLDSM